MSKDTQNNNEEYVSVSLEYGPGQTLADGREAKGLTIADVAARLNVTETIVNGLERDDYTNLPPTIYTRGYLRNYANLLEIDPEPLLERHKQLTSTGDDEQITRPAAIQAETSGRMIKKNKFRHKKDRSTSFFIILLVLMFIGIAYGIYAFVPKSSTSYPSSSAIEQQYQGIIQDSDENDNTYDGDESSISIPDEAKSQQLNPQEIIGTDDKQVGLSSEDETSQTLSFALSVNSQSDIDTESGQGDPDSLAVTADGIASNSKEQDAEATNASSVLESYSQDQENDNQATSIQDKTKVISDETNIKLIVADDSYIEITDSAGKRFFFRVLNAGSVKNITGKRPFKVVLGNAGAVKLEYNGEPFDFGNYGLGKVARFSLQ